MITAGQNESWEDQLEKDGKAADLIESCRSETEKEVKKYGEPARSEVLDAAITSLTGNVVHIPTRDYTSKISVMRILEYFVQIQSFLIICVDIL